jgi:hypothetical protein
MGCNVEARFSVSGRFVVREQRVFQGSRLAAESLMAFGDDPFGDGVLWA